MEKFLTLSQCVELEAKGERSATVLDVARAEARKLNHPEAMIGLAPSQVAELVSDIDYGKDAKIMRLEDEVQRLRSRESKLVEELRSERVEREKLLKRLYAATTMKDCPSEGPLGGATLG
jgi:hypothetical protein